MLALALMLVITADEPAPAPPPDPSTAPAEFAPAPKSTVSESVRAAVGKGVIVERKDGSIVAGTLTEASSTSITVTVLSGREIVIAGADIATIREKADERRVSAPAERSHVVAPEEAREERPRVPNYETEKRAERAERVAELNRQADAHAAAAWQWYLGAGSGCLTGVALFAGWLFIFASPACLIGAGVGVIAGAICGIVGLTETGAEQTTKNEASHAMAY